MKKSIIILFFILHSSFFTHCNAQIITTVAGNGYNFGTGNGGFSGDGGQATNAELTSPEGVVFDKLGNMYISDAGNGRIREVEAHTGNISTVAGGRTSLGLGDGGPATNAFLDFPSGIALDDSGNIYIADFLDNVIRKVTVSTGIINTVAGTPGTFNYAYYGDGGPATAACLDDPTDVALDDSGNIYIADFENNVIRKVIVSNGIITTVVGNGFGHYEMGGGSYTGGYTGNGGPATDAELFGPQAVKLDDSGNIYIADYWNNVVRKVTASTGIIRRIAGIHTTGYSGDGGAATAAELGEPQGLGLDSSGNVYIACGYNVVRKVTVSTGIITTIAGTGDGGYSGNGGLATNAELRQPQNMAFDSLGNLYIADGWNNVIRKVTYDTNIATGVNKLIAINEEIRVFPNPSNGIFNLYLSNINEKCNVEVFNYLGENIYNAKINSYNTEMNLGGQPNGVYLYRVFDVSGTMLGSGKVIIEK